MGAGNIRDSPIDGLRELLRRVNSFAALHNRVFLLSTPFGGYAHSHTPQRWSPPAPLGLRPSPNRVTATLTPPSSSMRGQARCYTATGRMRATIFTRSSL